MDTPSRTVALLSIAAAATLLTLTGCTAGAPASSDQGHSDDSGSTESMNDGGTDDSADPNLIVLSGTGRYAIGTEAPYGGYQIRGEPSPLPAGCTWSIQDADGEAFVDQANGAYAFLTDVPEAVTFVTEGCPDWEQFE